MQMPACPKSLVAGLCVAFASGSWAEDRVQTLIDHVNQVQGEAYAAGLDELDSNNASAYIAIAATTSVLHRV